jgi:hypothetical protein
LFLRATYDPWRQALESEYLGVVQNWEAYGPCNRTFILFLVFVGFFVLIGTVALLAIVGIIRTEPQFRPWAVGGFVASVAGVVIIWAKSEAPPVPIDIYVNLRPPEGNGGVTDFVLEDGTYEYQDGPDAKIVSGPVELL